MSVNPTMPTVSLYMRKDSKIRRPNSETDRYRAWPWRRQYRGTAYWLGKYSDIHILSFWMKVIKRFSRYWKLTMRLLRCLAVPDSFQKNKAMEQLEGMIGMLRVYTSRLATKESHWYSTGMAMTSTWRWSDPKNPSYLLIANDPEMESIIGHWTLLS